MYPRNGMDGVLSIEYIVCLVSAGGSALFEEVPAHMTTPELNPVDSVLRVMPRSEVNSLTKQHFGILGSVPYCSLDQSIAQSRGVTQFLPCQLVRDHEALFSIRYPGWCRGIYGRYLGSYMYIQ